MPHPRRGRRTTIRPSPTEHRRRRPAAWIDRAQPRPVPVGPALQTTPSTRPTPRTRPHLTRSEDAGVLVDRLGRRGNRGIGVQRPLDKLLSRWTTLRSFGAVTEHDNEVARHRSTEILPAQRKSGTGRNLSGTTDHLTETAGSSVTDQDQLQRRSTDPGLDLAGAYACDGPWELVASSISTISSRRDAHEQVAHGRSRRSTSHLSVQHGSHDPRDALADRTIQTLRQSRPPARQGHSRAAPRRRPHSRRFRG